MKLDLRDIPVYYINLDSAVDRREAMEEMTKKLGFKNVTRVEAIKHPRGSIGSGGSHDLILSIHKPPFIILEDDCKALSVDTLVDIPDDADAFYLGISSWGRFLSACIFWRRGVKNTFE